MKHLFEIEPQISDPKYGAEPCIRKLVESYYKEYFPESFKGMTDEYLSEVLDIYEKRDN